ncbi:unnamed protein product [Orchesella dallaii]|uniref:Uncharacterized protein n=1 Tax=Orchesella dallaii TaxID=48710 RepID=A0ABP1S0M9_9HEXA
MEAEKSDGEVEESDEDFIDDDEDSEWFGTYFLARFAMLSNTKLKALRCAQYIYWFWYDFPIGFDIQGLRIYIRPHKKWIPWTSEDVSGSKKERVFGYVFLGFPAIPSDMGDTLQALPRIKKNQIGLKYVERGSFARKVDRKRAAALMPIALSFGRFYPMGANFCRNFVGNLVEHLMAAVGSYVHSSAVLVGRSMLRKDLSLNINILNEYFQLEYNILSRYQRTLLDPKRKDFLDMVFWGLQLLHACSFGLIPFLIYFKTDTVYWVLEDIFGTNHLNRFPLEVSVILLVIRALIMSTALIENARMMVPSTLIFAEAMRRITTLVSVLSFKVTDSHKCFETYAQLTLLCNFAEKVTNQVYIVALTYGYCIAIQCACLCIGGYGKVDSILYSFFVNILLICCASLPIALRLIADMGDTLQALPRIKKNEMGLKYLERGSFARKVDRKRAAALMPIALSFGRFYPMGANFCRNFVGNLVEDLLAGILVIEDVLA